MADPAPIARRAAKTRRWTARRRQALRLPKGLKPDTPSGIVQIDTVSVQVGPQSHVKHFTAYDPVARSTIGKAFRRATAAAATDFLAKVLAEMPVKVEAIQVDSGLEFKARFEMACRDMGIILCELSPKSPSLNAGVERCNGAWRYEFYACYDLPTQLDQINSAHRQLPALLQPPQTTWSPWRPFPRRLSEIPNSRGSRVSFVLNPDIDMTAAPSFSILLPTRNRLDLARGAIETVRLQDDPDWELVLADNCSDDDVAGHVASLGDPRIRHIRSDRPLSVTDNWNRAIDAARGEFVMMLGDDDGLTPGYITAMRAEMAASGGADFAFHGGHHFTFPGVLPSLPDGALVDATANHAILQGGAESRPLAREEARRMAAAALRLNVLYGFNMQYFLFARRFLDRLREHGPVFQGPFPDFYAANLAMLAAERIWLVPRPMVIVGISPKSYGFHHFKRDEGTGADFLGIGPYLASREGFAKDLLPGSVMNSAWYLSVALIPRMLRGQPSPPLDTARYRRLQIVATVTAAARGEAGPGAVAALAAQLSASERAYLTAVRLAVAPARLLPKPQAGRWLRLVEALLAQQHPRRPPTLPAPVLGRYRTMPEVFHGLRTKGPR